MFSLRGDAHKIYLQLKKTSNNGQSFKQMKEYIEVEEIQNLYQSMDSDMLKIIYFRMIKENNGSGIIPILVSSVPWFLFLFSNQLQQLLFKEGSKLWIVFVILYMLILTFSVVLHFREKAWAAFHIQIIQDTLNERKRKGSSGNSTI